MKKELTSPYENINLQKENIERRHKYVDFIFS